jgi:hypothetical protein
MMRGEAKVTLLRTYCISLPRDTTLSPMDGKIKHCFCIKFCVKLGKSATKTIEMLREAFGELSSSLTVVSEWHSCFKAGQVSAEDDERLGRPSISKMTENVEKIKKTHQ